MAIANVQHGISADVDASGNPNSTSVAVTISAVASGNLVCGAVTYGGGLGDILTSVTDDKSNTYTIVDRTLQTTDSQYLTTFYLENITNGPVTITANFTANQQYKRICVAEFSGTASTSSIDGHTAQQQAGNTATDGQSSGNITTGTNGDLIYAAFIDSQDSGGTWSHGTNFATLDITGTNAVMGHEWLTQSTTGVIAGTFTESVSNRSVVGVMAFKAAVTAKSLAAGAGSYTLTGSAASLKIARRVSASTGAYTLTGTAATLRRNLPLVAGVGTYAIAGASASLLHKYVLPAAVGTYALTGTAATLKHGFAVVAAPGSYALNGAAATLRKTWRLPAGGGTYVLAGAAATLTYQSTKTVVAGVGTYALSGSTASLIKTCILAAAAGSYVMSGAAVNLSHGAAPSGSGHDYIIRARRRGRR